MATTTSESFVAASTQINSKIKEVVTTRKTEKIIFDKMILFNTNITTETIKVYIQTTRKSASIDNQVLLLTIPADNHLDVSEIVNIRLDGDQGLYFQATTAFKVNLHLSGRRIVD